MWDPHPPSKHASPLPPRPPARVTAAKRITFYKSGDSRFGGVRLAVHKRSFKCFDALLDDLSQKVPLPFGVRTVTTPRGVHAIKHLEQLQDGGCYLCSDRRRAEPVDTELAGRRPSAWHRGGRRLRRPESSSATPPGRSSRRRRIVLVKNSEPGMRRSVALSRRATRSLRAFLDEASEAMQFDVRKLYTAEGREIDGVQSLAACPAELVCVGREAFSPALVNVLRRSSEEKLPGLGSRSPGNGARSPAARGARSPPRSEHSGGPEGNKNVNFGLETKKSIIHPRSDSSNRSARFSSSSEKSYGDGVGASSRARPAVPNDDVEKRVLVNEDGSLSVEMTVRFRLRNDQTIQWSTRGKKSPPLTHGCPLSRAEPRLLQQGQSGSCSDPEGGAYSSQRQQRVLEGNDCPCCSQRAERQYDLWENPAHRLRRPPAPPPHASSRTHTATTHTHSSGSSSSGHSRRVVRCRTRVSDCGGSPERSRLVREEMFLTARVERRVEVQTGKKGDEETGSSSRLRGAAESHPTARAEETDRAPSSRSKRSRAPSVANSEEEEAADDEDEDVKRVLSSSSGHTELSPQSRRGRLDCGGCEREVNSNGGASQKSRLSQRASPKLSTPLSSQEIGGESEDGGSEGPVSSAQSNRTDLATGGRGSASANVPTGSAPSEESRAPRAASATSHKSNGSHEEKEEGRSPSAKSDESHKSTKAPERSRSPRSGAGEVGEGRAASQRSGRSVRSPMSRETNDDIVGLPSSKETEMPEDEQHRCESVTSARPASSAEAGRTNPPANDTAKTGDGSLGATSGKPHTSVKSSRTTASPNPSEDDLPSAETNGQAEQDGNVRVASVLSVKSRSSVESRTPHFSVSLGLPEDEDAVDSGSGRSSVSFRAAAERKSRVKTATPRVPEKEGAGSIVSQKSSGETARNRPAVDIPTIETPGGSRHRGGGAAEQPPGRGAGALSAKSSRSNKSSRSGGVGAGNYLETGSVRSGSATSDVGAPDSTPRSASAKVRSKSSASASGKKKVNVAKNSGDNVAENQAIGRAAGEADGEEETADKSPCGRRPEGRGEDPVREHKSRSRVKASGSQKKDMESSSPRPAHRPGSRVEAPGQSTPSPSPSARPCGRQSEASAKSTPKKRAKSRNRADPEALDPPPARLPNASPSEVVGDWLRSVPANSGTPALGDELQEEAVEEKPGEEEAKEEEEQETAVAKEGEEEDEGAACGAAEEEQSPGDACSSVTKRLLSPSLGRGRSVPEASPVYGRRLSTSARGLLDWLAQLQLIEPASRPGFDLKKGRHHEDIIATLQSLWLTEEEEATGAREATGVGTEQVSPPRSSSGVGMSSGSGGSGKENGNPPGGEPAPSKTTEASLPEEKVVEEEQSPDSPKAPDPSSSDESEAADDSSSAALRVSMSERRSQDPDPVWVLHLLKKLQKQIMSHYVSAVTEVKVRWDLADSVVLSAMTGELRDELSRRIQSSVDREVKKIQGRAGRGGRFPPRPPPPRGNLSGESVVTGNRRRTLKVMNNKQLLITAGRLSDDDTPGEVSDRRSDDEYCPCDACVRKKMDARPFKRNPLASEAPVVMEFDLLKILQLRKDPATVHAQPAAGGGDGNVADEEGRSVEVLQEEEEEDQTKEDIKAHIVLEETIPEEDEELEKEEAGEKEEKSSASDEAGEEMVKNGDEEEEEAECHCQRDINEEGEEVTAGGDAEEINDNTGEDETGEEDEREGEEGTGGEEEEEEQQSDLETVKAAGERESTEKDEEAAEVEECEASEEETTGRESGGEEASGETEDDNAGKREDFGEGNVSTSAEEEDDGDEESHEDEKGGESEEQGEEERASKGRGLTATEGEEADREDSDTDGKRPSDASADDSGSEGAETTGGQEEEEVRKRKAGALLHQFPRSSVEDMGTDAHHHHHPVSAIEVPKVATGGSAG